MTSAATLEMTLTGGTFEFDGDATVVIAGAAVTAHIEGRKGNRPVVEWTPLQIHTKERLVTSPIRSGVRTYLCVAGGILVPRQLGSRSTHLGGAFGGLSGRSRASDVLEVGDENRGRPDMQLASRQAFYKSRLSRRRVRAVDGHHRDTFDAPAIDSFWSTAFRVSMQSNRTGLRLKEKIGPSKLGGRMPSEGMMAGAVQVPESGSPIVLMVDHPTTGGYPVIACVAAVDLSVLDPARPRQTLASNASLSVAGIRGTGRFLSAEVPPR
jgi:antagonist of KipI